MLNTQVEDLKIEVLQLKRENLKLNKENGSLKVKLRKVQSSVSQKHKIIDNLIDPKMSSKFRREISEHGASLLMSLQEENAALKQKLDSQKALVKKLQTELGASKAYISNRTTVRSAKSKPEVQLQRAPSKVSIKTHKRKTSPDILEPKSNEYLLNKHYNSMIQVVKQADNKTADSDADSCDEAEMSDYENGPDVSSKPLCSEDSCGGKRFASRAVQKNLHDKSNATDHTGYESDLPFDGFVRSPKAVVHAAVNVKLDDGSRPHEEIEKLKGYFEDIINEVKTLKQSVLVIQKQQVRTSSALEAKDLNIEKLTTEVHNLNMVAARRSLPANKTDIDIFKQIQKASIKKSSIKDQPSEDPSYGLVPKQKKGTPRNKLQLKSRTDDVINIMTKNGMSTCTERQMEQKLESLIANLLF